MIVDLNVNEMSSETKKIIEVIDSINLMNTLLNDEKEEIKYRLKKVLDVQSILGENFRINISDNKEVNIILKGESDFNFAMNLKEEIYSMLNQDKYKINYKLEHKTAHSLIYEFDICFKNIDESFDKISQLIEMYLNKGDEDD